MQKPSIIKEREHRKFKWLNRAILLPILLWPLIAFGTIFFFDHPDSNKPSTWLLFVLVNAYPVYLVLLYKLNSRIFNQYGKIGLLMPFAVIFFIAYLLISQIIDSKKFKKEREEKERIRIAQGYLGNCKTYKLVNDSLFYKQEVLENQGMNLKLINCHYAKDSIFVYRGANVLQGADPKTYEQVNWQWYKDKNRYFFKGEMMKGIHYKSFQILDDNYSKDESNVYYKTNTLIGANPNNFVTSSGTYLGNDGVNFYKHGKLITTTNNR